MKNEKRKKMEKKKEKLGGSPDAEASCADAWMTSRSTNTCLRAMLTTKERKNEKRERVREGRERNEKEEIQKGIMAREVREKTQFGQESSTEMMMK